MSDLIRIDISGKTAFAWDRLFDRLTGIVGKAVDALACNAEPATRAAAKECAADIIEITKGWMQAKLQKPILDNEKTIAEIAIKFEELKMAEVKRRQAEIEADLKAVELEKERLELWELRLIKAMKWLGFLQTHMVREADGSVSLVLTNENMTSLLLDTRALQSGQ
jgi:hypothetical protein